MTKGYTSPFTYSNLPKCLTCGFFSRYHLLENGTLFDFKGKKFYGSWNYCICPYSPGPAPGTTGPTAEFILKHRRKEMKWFTATTRIILQEHDEANKAAEIEQLGSFLVEAESFDDAVTKAKDLLPDEYFQLIGVAENLA